MDNMYIYSIIKAISDKVSEIKKDRLFENKKIAIHGFNYFSSMVRTAMANQNIWVDYFALENPVQLLEVKRTLKNIGARYFNNLDAAINPISLEEASKIDNIILVSASQPDAINYQRIEENGFIEGINFIELHNWKSDNFTTQMKGKKKLLPEEMQKLEKEILKEFDAFCINNNLRYWVCGGTLLGTIRHQGFIPWDDDIDVFMPYKDYKRFVELYKDNESFFLGSLERKDCQEICVDSWGKLVERKTIIREHANTYYIVHPCWIDIFVLTGMPSDSGQRSDFFKRGTEANKAMMEAFYKSNGSIIERNKEYKKYQELFSEIDFDEAEYVGVLGTAYGDRDCTTRSVYDETLRMPFEDIEVNVPAGYKEYLDNLYGPDWMELPPPEKRQSHHNLEAYWL